MWWRTRLQTGRLSAPQTQPNSSTLSKFRPAGKRTDTPTRSGAAGGQSSRPPATNATRDLTVDGQAAGPRRVLGLRLLLFGDMFGCAPLPSAVRLTRQRITKRRENWGRRAGSSSVGRGVTPSCKCSPRSDTKKRICPPSNARSVLQGSGRRGPNWPGGQLSHNCEIMLGK